MALNRAEPITVPLIADYFQYLLQLNTKCSELLPDIYNDTLTLFLQESTLQDHEDQAAAEYLFYLLTCNLTAKKALALIAETECDNEGSAHNPLLLTSANQKIALFNNNFNELKKFWALTAKKIPVFNSDFFLKEYIIKCQLSFAELSGKNWKTIYQSFESQRSFHQAQLLLQTNLNPSVKQIFRTLTREKNSACPVLKGQEWLHIAKMTPSIISGTASHSDQQSYYCYAQRLAKRPKTNTAAGYMLNALGVGLIAISVTLTSLSFGGLLPFTAPAIALGLFICSVATGISAVGLGTGFLHYKNSQQKTAATMNKVIKNSL